MITGSSFWLRLIKKLKADHKVSLGPTIPYIIGAHKIRYQSSPTIIELLDNVLNSQVDKIALMQKCPDIGKYIMYLLDKDFCDRFMSKEINLINSKGVKGLIITQNARQLGYSLKDVSDNLNREYMQYVNENRFSWSRGKKRLGGIH